MIQHIIWLISSIALAAVIVGKAREFAFQNNWLDFPNQRSFHCQPTPRIGGWGLLSPVLLGLVVISFSKGFEALSTVWIILAPSFIVALLSFFDDRFDLSRILRFGIHLLCGLFVIWLLKEAWTGKTFPLLGQGLPVWIGAMLLLVWITGLTNAYNFMDGIDGIAAIQAIVATIGWLYVASSLTVLDPFYYPVELILICLLGGSIGFLVFNWSPASIFMGDSGSTFLGFFLAVLPIAFAYAGMPLERALEAGVLFTWPFVFDTGLTFIKRLARREAVFDAHRSHIYQLFANTFEDRESGHQRTALLFGTLSLLGIGLYRMESSLLMKLFIISGLWLMLLGWTWLRMRYAPRRKKTTASSYITVEDHQAFDIFLSPPHITKSEYKCVSQALDSGYIAPVGPQVNAFEESLAAYMGMEEVQAVSSGTAAIHLGLRALGVAEGDCVLCPDMTFIASCNPIRYLGAEPVLVDVSRDNWAMDPQILKEAIRSLKSEGRTIRAMVVVHALGIPAPMDDIMSIAREEGVAVLEDCAGAFGTHIGNTHVGTHGDAAAFSFNGNKVLTTSGGGALYLRDKDLRSSARNWANQGKRPGVIGYEHESLGYNYKLSNISAAIGLAQLDTVDDRLQKKRDLFFAYVQHLSKTGSLVFMPQPAYGSCNYWLSNIGLATEDKASVILQALRASRIEALPLWKPMHLQSFNSDLRCFGGEVSSLIHQRFLSLPSGTELADSQIERITDIIRNNLPVA